MTELFKVRYTKPDKEPTPPPSPEPTPEPSPVPSPVQEPELEESEKEPSPAKPERSETKPPSPNLPTYLQHKHQYLTEPEPDIIKRVKRETAREAREKRAAKRREALTEELELPRELQPSKRKRGKHKHDRHDGCHENVHERKISDMTGEDSDAKEDEKENEDRTEDDESPTVEITQGDVTLKFDYESSSPYSFIKQHDDTELSDNADHSQQPTEDEKSIKDEKHSDHSPSDSEDELISIGTPPTPPVGNLTGHNEPSNSVLPPTPTLDMEDPGLKSPPIITDNMTSSPLKISTMNYESNDGYSNNTSFGRQKSISIKTPELPLLNNSGSSSSLNESNDDDEDMIVDVVNSSNVVPHEDRITEHQEDWPEEQQEQNSQFNSASSSKEQNLIWQVSHESNGTVERQNSQASSVDAYGRQGSHEPMDDQVANHSDYENSTDEGSQSPGSGSEREVPNLIGERVSLESQASERDSPASDAGEENSENEDVDIESEGEEEPAKPLPSLKINRNRV